MQMSVMKWFLILLHGRILTCKGYKHPSQFTCNSDISLPGRLASGPQFEWDSPSHVWLSVIPLCNWYSSHQIMLKLWCDLIYCFMSYRELNTRPGPAQCRTSRRVKERKRREKMEAHLAREVEEMHHFRQVSG